MGDKLELRRVNLARTRNTSQQAAEKRWQELQRTDHSRNEYFDAVHRLIDENNRLRQQLNQYDNQLYEKEAEDADARDGRITEFTEFKVRIDKVGETRKLRRSDELGDLA